MMPVAAVAKDDLRRPRRASLSVLVELVAAWDYRRRQHTALLRLNDRLLGDIGCDGRHEERHSLLHILLPRQL
jgi:uncharacterized protein YjiS (DUF1127 family)